MIDFFRVLDVPRKPWIDAEDLKARFVALSTLHHPDRTHSTRAEDASGVDYSALNEAYNCLRDVPQRIAHLIELETGEKPPTVQNLPETIINWAFEAGSLLHEVDLFATEKGRNMSPMVAVRFFEQGMQLTDRIQALQGRIRDAIFPMNQRLRELNSAWLEQTSSPEGNIFIPLPCTELVEIYQQYAFLNRWNQQLQERISTLAI